MQRSRLPFLKQFYSSAVDGKGPLLESGANLLDLEQWMLSMCRRFAGSYAKNKTLIMNQSSFVLQKVEKIPDAASSLSSRMSPSSISKQFLELARLLPKEMMMR